MKLPQQTRNRAEMAIKALQTCQSNECVVQCWRCPYDGEDACIKMMQDEAAEMIQLLLAIDEGRNPQ